jgi:predicted nuclease of predicted toxin-antitoxin system
MRWLVDENVPRLVIDWLREQGADVLDVASSPHVSRPDEFLWRLAGQEERFILTRDLGFPWPTRLPLPPGIVVIRAPDTWNARQIMVLVVTALASTPSEALRGNVTVVEPARVRQHPISPVSSQSSS